MLNEPNFDFIIVSLKTDYQGTTTWHFCFRVTFSLKKAEYPIFVFIYSLFSIKKSLKVVNFSLVDERRSLNL